MSECSDDDEAVANDIFDEIETTFAMVLDLHDDNNNDATSVHTDATSVVENSWLELMSPEDFTDLEYTVIEMLNDYMETEVEHMYMASFGENMLSDIAELVAKQLCDAGFNVDDDDTDLEEFIKNMYVEVCASNSAIIPRSRETFAPEHLDESYKKHIDSILESLQNNEGQRYKQRTYEWYEYRAGLITASNIWKIFSGSQAVQNSLIYEKCKPFAGMASSQNNNADDDTCSSTSHHVNTRTPFHWGNKYEPLSIKIYEKKYNTRVAEFGCIRHSKYSCIGASPDGINVARDSPRYGRMIEVKNIYNRDITGIPKDEYWIQMQFQMETCGLTECDFIETRFKEYETEAEFYSNEFTHDVRGIILYFVERNVNGIENINPHYVYMPLDQSLEKDDVDAWIEKKKDEMCMTHHLYEVLYWYLDEFSCVLVELNKLWMDNAIPKVESFWKTICEEKVSGFEHRSAKKRVPKEETGLSGTKGGFCLIKLDADGNAL